MNKIPIFMYHHISSFSHATPLKSLFVSPKVFQAQMKLMYSLGYEGKSISELMPFLKGEKEGKVFGITFDDGYQDVYFNALPILKKFKFSSTCYIVSGQIDGYNRWDEKHKDRHQLMTFDQLKNWLESGQDVGVHTVNHVNLSELEPIFFPDEILDCRNFLQTHLELNELNHFCYPYGKYNEQVVEFLSCHGFESATTTQRSLVRKSNSLLELPRIFMKNDMGAIKTFFKINFG